VIDDKVEAEGDADEIEIPESVLDVATEVASETISGGYDYLLRMPLWSLTLERVSSLLKERDEKAAELNLLLKTSSQQMWLRELDDFEVAYEEV
jgi:DNA topoisomerase II